MESSARREEAPILTPRQIFERLDRFVIGQEEAKRAVAIAAHNHLKRLQAKRMRRTSLIKKSNILLIGPTGSGKTHIARNLAEILSVPFTTVDATEYTEAGYYGKDVEVMVSDLLFKANHSIEDTQRGIIFIDEVDKIARRTQSMRNGAGSRDIGGEGVQQALLKLLEGTVANVPPQGGRKHPHQEFIQIDTTNILFICGGAFVGLDSVIERRLSQTSMGFGAKIASKKEKKTGELLAQVHPEDLIKFGLIPEFVGRLPVVATLSELDRGALIEILREPKNSLVRQYQTIMGFENVELRFTDDALEAIAEEALKRNVGARGLKIIIEELMLDIMYTIPSEHSITECLITREVVDNRTQPITLHKKAS